jgi:hypothetical protein
MDDAGEHLLAGAGLAGDEDGERCGGDAPGDGEDLGCLLGGPDGLGLAVDGVGGPERGALLLVAPVAVERDGGGQQLADGGQGAAVVEGGPGTDEQVPVFVAVQSDGLQVGLRRTGGGQRLVGRPAVGLDDADRAIADGDERDSLRTARVPDERHRLVTEHVRMAGELEQRHCAVEVGEGRRL